MRSRRLLLLLLALAVLGRAPGHAAGSPQELILDTDGDADYDDVVGVMVAAASPGLDLLGVVVTGRDVERRGRAVAKALDVMGRDDVGIHLGEPPWSPPPPDDGPVASRGYGLRPQLERWSAGFPLAPSPENGVDFYLRTLTSLPGEVSVVVTGPLSTLGKAVQLGDEHGTPIGDKPKQVLFTGGDFASAEFNVSSDIGAARAVLRSGGRIWAFTDGPGKAYLRWEDRQRLWTAATPATWALQDLYRTYRAGWDVTSPFVPILYDVHPVAFLVAGESISRFAPASVDVDTSGRLRRVEGPPNVQVRVENHGDALVQFALARLTDPVVPAMNHVHALLGAAGPATPLGRELEGVVDELSRGDVADSVRTLEQATPEVEPLGARALRHLELARKFLAGDPRPDAWRDPYTPRTIAVLVGLLSCGAFLLRAAPILVPAALGAILLWWWRRHLGGHLPPGSRVRA